MQTTRHKQFFSRIFNTRLTFHYFFWLTLLPTTRFDILPDIARLIFTMLLVYTNLNFLIPRFYNRSRIVSYWSLLLLSSLLFCVVSMSFNYLLFHVIRHDMEFSINIQRGFTNNLIYCTRMLFLSALLKISTDWFDQQRKIKELQISSLESELNYLKAQINPHFLFNTLNNLFALAQKRNNTELAVGISKLSGLFRYIIHDNSLHTVKLTKEIAYIKDYIEIFMLRMDTTDDININFEIQGDTENIFIPPMLIVPFIENAFKHGINFKDRSFINATLSVTPEELRFHVRNSDHSYLSKGKKESTGIGLDNVKKRLDLIYPDRYTLDITKNADTFSVDLLIKLS